MSDDVVAKARQALANYEQTADMGGALTGAFHLGCEARTLMPRLVAEVERLTEQLIDARITITNRLMELRNYSSYPPNERHICAGMTPEAFAAYLADPRGFMRQKIMEEQ